MLGILILPMCLAPLAAETYIAACLIAYAPVWSLKFLGFESQSLRNIFLLFSGPAPYRDSMLTQLLSDAFGGHCRTTLVATVVVLQVRGNPHPLKCNKSAG